jgi:hypothetical protein
MSRHFSPFTSSEGTDCVIAEAAIKKTNSVTLQPWKRDLSVGKFAIPSFHTPIG